MPSEGEKAIAALLQSLLRSPRDHQLLNKVYGFRNIWISSQDFTDFSEEFTSILYAFIDSIHYN